MSPQRTTTAKEHYPGSQPVGALRDSGTQGTLRGVVRGHAGGGSWTPGEPRPHRQSASAPPTAPTASPAPARAHAPPSPRLAAPGLLLCAPGWSAAGQAGPLCPHDPRVRAMGVRPSSSPPPQPALLLLLLLLQPQPLPGTARARDADWNAGLGVRRAHPLPSRHSPPQVPTGERASWISLERDWAASSSRPLHSWGLRGLVPTPGEQWWPPAPPPRQVSGDLGCVRVARSGPSDLGGPRVASGRQGTQVCGRCPHPRCRPPQQSLCAPSSWERGGSHELASPAGPFAPRAPSSLGPIC